MDVGRNDSIREAIAAAVKTFGGIDIVVNNAGILSALSIEEMTREEWDKVLNVNLGGTFFVIQAALPFLKKSQNPRIINISSLTGRNGGFEGSMCYAASKGGVISITRGMARRLAPFNITVNAVCPGPTETEILKGYTSEAQERQRNVSLLRRLGQPEEIAAAICYLASTEAAFVTGAMLDVNGGAYMG
jgi:3-oxoacyl-[acyl-carrier protein] reductase